jgi:hypothetical protein
MKRLSLLMKQIHKIFKIKHNGWMYEKVCLDELSN